MDSSNRRSFKKECGRIAWFSVCISLFLSLLGFAGKIYWVFDLSSHFTVQYLLAGVAAFFVFVAQRNKRGLAVSGLLVILNAVQVLPWYFPDDVKVDKGQSLKIILFNVNVRSQRFEEVIQFFRDEDPDIIVVEEVNHEWVDKLKVLTSTWKFYDSRHRPDSFGIAVYSKIPCDDIRALYLGKADVPSFSLTLQLADQKISLLATHPVPPINSTYYENRNNQLEEVKKFLSFKTTKKILIGDFNLTMWSPFYRELLENSGLKNTRQGFGIQSSWPTQMFLLHIPLDHCFVSEGIGLVDTRVGPNLGSDHLPLIVTLKIPYLHFNDAKNETF